jgi:Family of unknown function (DUF6228)
MQGDYFQVALKGCKVSAETTVHAYTDANGLNNLFQELGKLDQPWGNEKIWKSIEDDFSIAITCDKLGHVSLKAKIRIRPGHPEEAYIEAGLVMDFGSLSYLSRDAQEFFDKTNLPWRNV